MFHALGRCLADIRVKISEREKEAEKQRRRGDGLIKRQRTPSECESGRKGEGEGNVRRLCFFCVFFFLILRYCLGGFGTIVKEVRDNYSPPAPPTPRGAGGILSKDARRMLTKQRVFIGGDEAKSLERLLPARLTHPAPPALRESGV